MDTLYRSGFIGDQIVLTLPLKNRDGTAFTPAEDYALILTAKHSDTDEDADAVFQLTTGAGIVHSTSNAVCTVHRDSTVDLDPHNIIFDVQAQHVVTGEVIKTVAYGRLQLHRDITRETTTSVPVITTETPLPFGPLIPSQTDNSGKYLTTDGTDTSWGTIDLSTKQPLDADLTAYATAADAQARRVLIGSEHKTRTTAEGAPDSAPASMVVSGGGSASLNGEYVYQDTYNGKPRYAYGLYTIRWTGFMWSIGTLLSGSYTSESDVATPDLVVTWGLASGTGPVPAVEYSPGAVLAADHIGQLCRVGDAAPYDWYQWNETSWVFVRTDGEIPSSDLTSGPVTSSAGVSAIADGAIGVAKITGLGTAATADMDNATINAALSTDPAASKSALEIPEHQMAVATSDSAVIQNITPIDDAELVLAVEANATYLVRANICGTSVNDFSTGGMRVVLSGPTCSGVFLRYQKLCYGTASSAVATQTAASFLTDITASAVQISGVATVTSTYTSQLEGIFTVGITGGALKLQIAQQVNGGAGLTRKAGSTFELIKL